MSIPNEKIKLWSKKGSNSISNPAHNKLRRVLGDPKYSNLKQKDKSFTTMLQGSYINFTNIEGNSDVDLVVKLKLFKSNIHLLSYTKRKEFEKSFSTLEYPFSEYRNDVYETLVSFFGTNKVLSDSKSIKVNIQDDYWADVVPVFRFLKFNRDREDIDFINDFVEGIYFETEDGEPIINYPTQHKDNGHIKNKETNEMFRNMVRAFKNARTHLVENNKMTKNAAPSYFIENLIYNVPNKLFCDDYQITFKNIIDYLDGEDIGNCLCQNGQVYIFGSNSWQWNEVDARIFIQNTKELWENW